MKLTSCIPSLTCVAAKGIRLFKFISVDYFSLDFVLHVARNLPIRCHSNRGRGQSREKCTVVPRPVYT